MEHRTIPGWATLSLIAFLLIISCTPSQQQTETTRTDTTSGDTVAVVAEPVPESTPSLKTEGDIRRAYAATLAKLESGALDSTSFKYDCSGERSGTVSYFTENGKLKMIVHRYSEYSHYSATDQYLVQDDQLAFAYLNGVAWTFDGGEGSTKDNITERRIYLVDGRPVKCLEKEFIIRSAATDNPRSETVPNRQVNCKAAEDILKPYRMLLKHHNKPAPSCLEK